MEFGAVARAAALRLPATHVLGRVEGAVHRGDRATGRLGQARAQIECPGIGVADQQAMNAGREGSCVGLMDMASCRAASRFFSTPKSTVRSARRCQTARGRTSSLRALSFFEMPVNAQVTAYCRRDARTDRAIAHSQSSSCAVT